MIGYVFVGATNGFNCTQILWDYFESEDHRAFMQHRTKEANVAQKCSMSQYHSWLPEEQPFMF